MLLLQGCSPFIQVLSGKQKCNIGNYSRVTRGQNMKLVPTGGFNIIQCDYVFNFSLRSQTTLTRGILCFNGLNIQGRQLLVITLSLLHINCHNSLKNAATDLKFHF